MWPTTIREEYKRVPAGSILFKIDEVKGVTQPLPWGDPSTPYLQEIVTLSVVEPEEYAGITHEQIFPIGSNDDPTAQREETRMKGGASRFQTLASKAGVQVAGADEQVVRSELKDHHVGATIIWKLTADGFIRPRVMRWFTEGDSAVGADTEAMEKAIAEATRIAAGGGAARAGAAPLPPRARLGGDSQHAGPGPTAPLPPPRPAAPLPRIGR